MRKHLGWYIKGFRGASSLRKELMRVETIKQIENILKKRADQLSFLSLEIY